MSQTVVSATGFEPTPGMIERHRSRVREIVSVVWEWWGETGQIDVDPEAARDAIRHVEREHSVESRPDWMHPLDAIAVIMSMMNDVVPDQMRADYFDAMRTRDSLTPGERAKWVASAMGLKPAHVQDVYGAKSEHRERGLTPQGRTALYRHRDTDGVLLYVGITHNPEMRLKMHRHSAAPWLQFSAECALEWHATREDALLAERAAIRTEKPLFNVAHSVVDSALPVAYLAKFRPIL